MWQPPAPAGIRVSTSKPGRTAQLLAWISERFCHHQFSWPHIGLHGRDYQVCVLCGAAYEYDWTAMRRTCRLGAPPAPRT